VAAPDLMVAMMMALGLPQPEREYRFHETRRWRFDYAFPDRKVALEVEGVTPSGGRHQRVKGYAADCEKYSVAAADGWRVIRATPRQLESGVGFAWLLAAYQAAG
jgi:uncharacterized protein (UPF0128 family)